MSRQSSTQRSVGDTDAASLLFDDRPFTTLRAATIGEQVWCVAPDAVHVFQAADPRELLHRIALPPSSSTQFSGALCAVRDAVWLGFDDGAVRAVRRNDLSQIGNSVRTAHRRAVTDIATVDGTVATTSTDGRCVLWLDESPPKCVGHVDAGLGALMAVRAAAIDGAGAFVMLSTAGAVATLASDVVNVAARAVVAPRAMAVVLPHRYRRELEAWVCGGDGRELTVFSIAAVPEALTTLVVPSRSPVCCLEVAGANVLCGTDGGAVVVLSAASRAVLHRATLRAPLTSIAATAQTESWSVWAVGGDGAKFADLAWPAEVAQRSDDAETRPDRAPLVSALKTISSCLLDAGVSATTALENGKHGDGVAALSAVTAIDAAHSVITDVVNAELTAEELAAWTMT
jgi:hypothetical protein